MDFTASIFIFSRMLSLLVLSPTRKLRRVVSNTFLVRIQHFSLHFRTLFLFPNSGEYFQLVLRFIFYFIRVHITVYTFILFRPRDSHPYIFHRAVLGTHIIFYTPCSTFPRTSQCHFCVHIFIIIRYFVGIVQYCELYANEEYL